MQSAAQSAGFGMIRLPAGAVACPRWRLCSANSTPCSARGRQRLLERTLRLVSGSRRRNRVNLGAEAAPVAVYERRDRWPSRVSGAGLATVTAWEGARVFQRSAACRKEMKDLKGAARRRVICLIGQRSVY